MAFFIEKIPSTQIRPGDPTFADIETRHRCLVCKNVLRDAMQTTCGHRICENCVPEIFEGKTEPVICPANEEDCDKLHRSQITPDPCGRREVRKLKAYCTYKERGCTEVLVWTNLEQHANNCEYRPVQCSNGDCTNYVSFQNLDNHVANECRYRPVLCKYCGERVPFCEQEEHIQQTCKSVKNDPNQRKQSIGCQITDTVKGVAAHMVQDLHAQNKQIRCQLQEAAERMVQDLNALSKQIRDHLQRAAERMIQDLNAQNQQIRRQLEDSTTERDQFRQQVQDLQKKVVLLTERTAYLERSVLLLESASYDGTLLWKISDYTRRKQAAVAGKILSRHSQPFYTHRYGYKMCARVYLNGDGVGKGTHMSLFFVVMQGAHDELLPWPFLQKISMTLLDQIDGQTNRVEVFKPDLEDMMSFRKPTSAMNIGSGCPKFVPQAVLETSRYLKDDTLFLKLQVDLKNLQHP